MTPRADPTHVRRTQHLRTRRPRTGRALVAALGLVTIGIGVGAVHRNLHVRAETAAADALATTMQQISHDELTLTDLERGFVPVPVERLDALNQSFRPRVADVGVVEMTVWNREQWTVYSTRAETVGHWSADRDVLHVMQHDETVVESVASGDGTLRLLTPIVATNRAQRGVAGVRVVGVLDVQVPYATIAAHVDSSVRRAWVAIAAGIALAGLVVHAARQWTKRRVRVRRGTPEAATAGIGLAVLYDRRLVVRPAIGTAVMSVISDDVTSVDSDDVGVLLLGSVGYTNDGPAETTERFVQLRSFVEATIGSTLTSGDLVAHMGGDDVAILMSRVSRSDVDTAVDRVVGALDARQLDSGCVVDLRAPFGVIVLERPDGECDRFLRDADVVFEGAAVESTRVTDVDELV